MPIIGSAYKPLAITAAATPCVRRQDFNRDNPAGTKLLDYINRLTADKKAALAKLLPLFTSNNFPKSWIEETDDSIKINDWQLNGAISWDYNPDYLLRDKARLHVIADLAALGFEVGFVSLDPQYYEMLNNDVVAAAQSAGVKMENLALLNRIDPSAEDFVLSFPRDLLTQLGNSFYFLPALRGFDLSVIKNWARGFNLSYDNIANGGAVVVAKHERFSFVSDPAHKASQYRVGSQSYLEVKNEETARQRVTGLMRQSDIKLYSLPVVWMDAFPPSLYRELNFKKKVLFPNVHIDLAVMYLSPEQALFVSERYYQENKDRLDQIADDIKPNIFDTLPDEDGLPINSLPLPGGGVYMDSQAQQAIAKVRGHNIEVFETSIPVGTWGWGAHGGLHCATNIINVLDADVPSDLRI